MHPQDTAPEGFTVLDWIGAVLSAFGVLGLLVFPIAGRTFARMYDDVSGSSDLPIVTRLATSVWFPLLLAIPAIACLALALRRGTALRRRRALVVGAFLSSATSFGVCLVGVYLPLFTLARAIRPG